MHDADTADRIGPQRGREIRPRKMGFVFRPEIPRHWFGGSPFATHMANGLNLLFPMGERFFVRAVHHFADRVTDPVLSEQIKGFVGQEVRHGIEHERFFEILEAQGYDIRTFLRVYDFLGFDVIERAAPQKLRLAVTAALEHFTATLARTALSHDFLQFAEPTMRDLFRWHAAEEIEHKCVAFDVLRIVDDSYALRMAGLFVATATLVPFWFSAALMLMAQDRRDVPLRALLADRRRIRALHREQQGRLVRAFLEYVRRDFHPSQHDDAHLARQYFEQRTAG